jgi:HPt (histidine-containing phosphotransfer) domain-containing protein
VDTSEQPSLSGALDALWTRFRSEIMGRVAALESAAEACHAGRLSAEQQKEAHANAHNLAGVLGTFGLARGTQLARELELTFSSPDGIDPARARFLPEIASELRAVVESRK